MVSSPLNPAECQTITGPSHKHYNIVYNQYVTLQHKSSHNYYVWLKCLCTCAKPLQMFRLWRRLTGRCVFVIVWCVCVCVQRSPRHMLTPLTAALLELCENPPAVAHLLRWSGERDTSAPQLLLHIWRREEEQMCVSRDPHGMIAGAHAFDSQTKTRMSCH